MMARFQNGDLHMYRFGLHTTSNRTLVSKDSAHQRPHQYDRPADREWSNSSTGALYIRVSIYIK